MGVEVKRLAPSATVLSGASVMRLLHMAAELDLCAGDTELVSAGTEPTFADITSEAGESVLILRCTTDREAIVRYRARRLVGGVPLGGYYLSSWETIPDTGDHARLISGLAAAQTYRVWIEVNATVNPDLPMTLFAAGGVGPDFTTAAKGTEDPADPGEA